MHLGRITMPEDTKPEDMDVADMDEESKSDEILDETEPEEELDPYLEYTDDKG